MRLQLNQHQADALRACRNDVLSLQRQLQLQYSALQALVNQAQISDKRTADMIVRSLGQDPDQFGDYELLPTPGGTVMVLPPKPPESAPESPAAAAPAPTTESPKE